MKTSELPEIISKIKSEIEIMDDTHLLDRWISFSLYSPRDRILSGDRDVLERGVLETVLIRRFGINFDEVVERRRRRVARLPGNSR